jgi:hypothetical protein
MAKKFVNVKEELLHPENYKVLFHGGIYALAIYIFAQHGDFFQV